MTHKYVIQKIDEPLTEQILKIITKTLTEIARKKHIRATPEGIKEGIGFSYDTPYNIAYGLAKKGIIDIEKGKPTETGYRIFEAIVDISSIIKPEAAFPELDRGKIIGALLYAFYDWSGKHENPEEYLECIESFKNKIMGLKKENYQAFSLLARLLPRVYYEDGYSPQKLLEDILRYQ